MRPVAFRVEPGDWLRSRSYALRDALWRLRWVLALFGASVGSAALALALADAWSTAESLAATGAGLALALTLVLRRGMLRPYTPRDVTVDPGGIRIRWGDQPSEDALGWSELEELREVEGGTLLCTADRVVAFVPARAGSREDIEALRAASRVLPSAAPGTEAVWDLAWDEPPSTARSTAVLVGVLGVLVVAGASVLVFWTARSWGWALPVLEVLWGSILGTTVLLALSLGASRALGLFEAPPAPIGGRMRLVADDRGLTIRGSGRSTSRPWTALQAITLAADRVVVLARPEERWTIPVAAFAGRAEADGFVRWARDRGREAAVRAGPGEESPFAPPRG